MNSYLCFETEAGNRILLRFASVSAEYSVVLDALVQRILLRAAILLRGGLWPAHWRAPALGRHSACVASDSLLDGDSVSEALEWVPSLESLELSGGVLINELID